ncbi:MAG: hypothetical protein N0C79_21205 [Candidatus Thiodiazotropha taylori]|nr:hypothetical protein [Candidatus Thiodiazotropha taylori]MCG8047709.1 hypothetical protein [Candidatus Thiodiazotropha taylori]MCW4315537.1 hypothetical protein [Candidatus Thiodiazotropha taylori]MCW4323539.1 hypothetical protein [Candidatus Thiodiazotropha taylori]MCW4345450.1 hypothetical protein [Candidatus Thiodiazotropha endolucinida]
MANMNSSYDGPNIKIALLERIQAELAHLPEGDYDLADIGNSISLAVSEFLQDRNGFRAGDFAFGIEHGLFPNRWSL